MDGSKHLKGRVALWAVFSFSCSFFKVKHLFSLKAVFEGGVFGEAASGHEKGAEEGGTGNVCQMMAFTLELSRSHKLWMTLINSMPFPNNEASAGNPTPITSKNSLLSLKSCNDDKNLIVQPCLPASVTPACPGTVPIKCPWSSPVSAAGAESPAQRLFAAIRLCNVCTQLASRQGVQVWNPSSLNCVIWISKWIPVPLVPPSVPSDPGVGVGTRGRLYCHSFSCCVTSLGGCLKFIWL